MASYRALVDACADALLYHSPQYLAAVAAIAGDARCSIIGAWRGPDLVAALPGFIQSTNLGTVYNSGPYFGSHGDMLIREGEGLEAVNAIADTLKVCFDGFRVDAANIVSHPLCPRIQDVADRLGLAAWDERIGQISSLPTASNRGDALEKVLHLCNQKARNLVRKGLKQGFSINRSFHPGDWQSFALHHRLNMAKIGGRAKAEWEFDALRGNLSDMTQLYVAKSGGQFAGALLLFRFKDWIEYFTPVAVEEFRSSQVTSALIGHAMCDGILSNAKWWNWGGTWTSQSGVHHFKQSWGAIDKPYRYYGALFGEKLRHCEPESARAAFPFFYVRPFD